MLDNFQSTDWLIVSMCLPVVNPLMATSYYFRVILRYILLTLSFTSSSLVLLRKFLKFVLPPLLTYPLFPPEFLEKLLIPFLFILFIGSINNITLICLIFSNFFILLTFFYLHLKFEFGFYCVCV